MFAANYEDGRTAYFVVEGHGPGANDHLVPAAAADQQKSGILPEGHITRIKRVR
jgi:hypothetical protein